MFSVRTTLEEFENAKMANRFGFGILKKTQAGKSHDYRNVIVFEKLNDQTVFRPY